MKTEMAPRAERNGTVNSVGCQKGEMVEEGRELVDIDADNLCEVIEVNTKQRRISIIGIILDTINRQDHLTANAYLQDAAVTNT